MPKLKMKINAEAWIQGNKSFLSIRAIESHLGLPDSTLTKVSNGKMKLPKKHEPALLKFIKELNTRYNEII